MKYRVVDLGMAVGYQKYATFDELNAEGAEAMSALNNIDNDNIATNLGVDKTARKAFGELVYEDLSTTGQEITTAPNLDAGFTTPLIDALGNPWSASIVTGDALLRGALRVELFNLADGGNGVYAMVRVDGVLYGRSPATCGFSSALSPSGTPKYVSSTLNCNFVAPVGAGLHRVDFLLGVTRRSRADASVLCELGSRAYFLQECLR